MSNYETMEREFRQELIAIVERLKNGKGGHIYYGPDCLLCGHYGPNDAPEFCVWEGAITRAIAEREELTKEPTVERRRCPECGGGRVVKDHPELPAWHSEACSLKGT